jgi:hypothetical protein
VVYDSVSLSAQQLLCYSTIWRSLSLAMLPTYTFKQTPICLPKIGLLIVFMLMESDGSLQDLLRPAQKTLGFIQLTLFVKMLLI